MSIRIFVFCDLCNPEGIRNINNRYRMTDRREINNERRIEIRRTIKGRRNGDGRSWYEGTLDAAIEQGWSVAVDNKILCPDCIKLVAG